MNTRFEKALYEKGIYQFLSVYRFLAFALAMVLIAVVTPDKPGDIDVRMIVILSSLGAYTLFKVFSPIRWWQRDPMTYVVLVGDLAICIVLLLYTGGLSSGLLLYSLTPIMTAALLFEERVSLSAATIFSVFLVLGHLVFSRINDNLEWIMESNLLPLLIVYIIFCFLVALISYRTNLNIRRHIETDAILDERRRMKREIHDGVAQTLTYLNLKTSQVTDAVSSKQIEKALKGLADIHEMVKDAYDDIRESIDQLGAEGLEAPIVSTMASYIREFGQQNDIETQFNAPRNRFEISPVAELQMLRIVQEALTNVRKHAKADKVRVSLDYNQQQVQMEVKDNGEGFLLGAGQRNDKGDGQNGFTRHHGLGIMNERAESLGGTMVIIAAPGEGTEIKVSFPGDKVRL
ncbi:sensor histidine kinase [Chloroflexota bacterium]